MLTDELDMLQTFTDALSEALHGSVAAKRQELLADMSAASKRPANRGSNRGSSHEPAASHLLTPTPRSISTVAPFTPRAATAPDAAGAPANISSSNDTPRTHATPILRPRPASDESSTYKGAGAVERLGGSAGGGAGAVGVGVGVPDAFVKAIKATPPKIALELAAIPVSKGVSAGGAAGRGAGGAERAQTHRPSSSGMRRAVA